SADESQCRGSSPACAATGETQDGYKQRIYSATTTQTRSTISAAATSGGSHVRVATGHVLAVPRVASLKMQDDSKKLGEEIFRESKEPWRDILREMKQDGYKQRIYSTATTQTSSPISSAAISGGSHARAARETPDEAKKRIYKPATTQTSSSADESQCRGPSHARAATGHVLAVPRVASPEMQDDSKKLGEEIFRESKEPWRDILREMKQRR
ncbi:hypothetical protein T484DRAFT_3627238, partial [Baffinella frigidus]